MHKRKNIGIIICDRYSGCAGGKCFRALRNREGAFNIHTDHEVELVGYTTCGGCPGGNVEYCLEEMKKNGVEVIHFATGMVVGYPPCPYIDHFYDFIKQEYGVNVIIGTHPIPQSYYENHTALGTWTTPEWKEKIKQVLGDKRTRLKYI
ncbi:MAG: CGGC domain-containing protein [Candidatus Bathyarchaeia archaeon]